MANAETAGFTGDAYQVQVRQAGTFSAAELGEHAYAQDLAAGYSRDSPDEQASP